MSFVVAPDRPGTTEEEWAAVWRAAPLAPVRWGGPPPAQVVAVAPHPDDEVLGVGGCLRHLSRCGSHVTVVAVTDGEGSHPGSTRATPAALRSRRRAERDRALALLGLGRADVVELGLPDGDVAGHEADLEAALDELVAPGALCLAPWRHDGHPDHEAVGRAAARAAHRARSRLLEFPVWAWHWAGPAGPGTPALPWSRCRAHLLDPGAQVAKGLAIEAYESQIAPLGPAPEDRTVLPAAVLARFRRPFEVLVEGRPG